MQAIQLFWSRKTLKNSPFAKLLEIVEEVHFLGYAERNGKHLDIIVRVVFKDGKTPLDLSVYDEIFELTEVLDEPQSDWSKDWVLQIQLLAELGLPIEVNLKARSASITPDTLLNQSGLNFVITGPAKPVKMVVNALRMSLKPDRFSASSIETSSIMENSIVSPQQLRVVKAAWNAGWYANSRSLKMTDLAREIGLSRSTVSEHLNRVETELVRLLLDSVGSLEKETIPQQNSGEEIIVSN